MVKIIEAQPDDYARLLRNWMNVLRDLHCQKLVHVTATLIDVELDRVEDGALVLRFPDANCEAIFRKRQWGNVVSQAIHKITGLHCGIRTYWAGEEAAK